MNIDVFGFAKIIATTVYVPLLTKHPVNIKVMDITVAVLGFKIFY